MHGGRGEWEERRNVKIKLGGLKILQESLLHLRGQLAKFRFFLKLLACKLQKLLHPLKTVSLGCHNTVNPISGKGWPVLENTSLIRIHLANATCSLLGREHRKHLRAVSSL